MSEFASRGMKWYVVMAAITITVASHANACNIPVFRYALERWQPDACEVFVFHNGTLSAVDEKLIRSIETASTDSNGHANVKLIRCAIASDLDAAHRELWDSVRKLAAGQAPYAVVRTSVGGRWVNHWHGSLGDAAKLNLLESPARTELSRRLLARHSVVWLILKSADQNRTKKAKDLLETNFQRLSKTVSLPEGVGLPGSELHSEVPLLLKFSALEIDVADEKEQFLVSLLKGFRPEAVEQGEPLLVPVFGRGRALEVIPADALDERLMEDLTMFLSAACSCQVKEQNPGFDLLISADWDTQLFGADGLRPPPAKKVGDGVKSAVPLTIPPGR